MRLLLCAFLMCFIIANSEIISDEEYKKLPPIYDIDSYSKCKLDNNLFCKVEFKLTPSDDNNTIWKLIEVTKTDRSYYLHDTIYRRMCIRSSLQGKKEDVYQSLAELENVKLINLSLKAQVNDIKCVEDVSGLSTYDCFLGALLIGYATAIGYATMYDISRRKNTKTSKSPQESNKYIQSLSVIYNWEKLKRPINKFDYNKLRCFQGIRTYNIILVVGGHTALYAFVLFKTNPNYVESFYANTFTRGIGNLGLHLVQTFYLFSAWLLSVQIHETLDKNKKITIRDVTSGIVFRYLRLAPTVIAFLTLQKSSFLLKITEGPQTDLIVADHNGCKTNWWYTILFLNSYLYPNDMCHFGTWYLANDFQMFIISLVIFYVMVKFKLDIKIFGIMFIVPWLIHAVVIYHHNLDVIFNTTPENTKIENAFISYSVYALYTSLYSNCASYVIGIVFGSIYYKYRDAIIEVDTKLTALWIVGFLGLPLLSVILSLQEYPPIINAIIGPSLKPIFTLGVAIGVLGMSFNIGGVVKQICEWSFAEFISKWSYSTYLWHFIVVFARYTSLETLIEVSHYLVIKDTVINAVFSFAGGFLIHILLELPLANILNHVIRPDKKSSNMKSSKKKL